MDDSVRPVLKDIFERHGHGLIDDVPRFESTFETALPDARHEQELLVLTLGAQLPQRLRERASLGYITPEAIEHFWLDVAQATGLEIFYVRWAIETWAYALKLPVGADRQSFPIRTFYGLDGFFGGITSVAFAPDGRTALSGSGAKIVTLWDLSNGEIIRTFEGHTGGIGAVAITPDGRTALSASWDATLKLWELSSGACLRTFTGHTDSVQSVAIAPDGRTALSGSWDATFKLWDLSSGACLRTFTGHTDKIYSVAFAPNGQDALSGSRDGDLNLWSLSSGKCQRSIEKIYGIFSIAVAPDSRTALVGEYKTPCLLDLSNGHTLRTFTHSEWIRSVAIAPDGRTGLSGGQDEIVRLFDLSSGDIIRSFVGHTDPVSSVAFAPDGRTALSGSVDKTLKLWDLT